MSNVVQGILTLYKPKTSETTSFQFNVPRIREHCSLQIPREQGATVLLLTYVAKIPIAFPMAEP